MSQIFIEGGALTQSGDNLLTKLAEFLNNIGALKIQAKVDGKRIAISPKAATPKTTPGKAPSRKTTRKGEERKKKGKKATSAEAAMISKSKLKVYLKRFINNEGLNNDLRVISGGKDTFIFHAKPIYEEEPAPQEGA